MSAGRVRVDEDDVGHPSQQAAHQSHGGTRAGSRSRCDRGCARARARRPAGRRRRRRAAALSELVCTRSGRSSRRCRREGGRCRARGRRSGRPQAADGRRDRAAPQPTRRVELEHLDDGARVAQAALERTVLAEDHVGVDAVPWPPAAGPGPARRRTAGRSGRGRRREAARSATRPPRLVELGGEGVGPVAPTTAPAAGRPGGGDSITASDRGHELVADGDTTGRPSVAEPGDRCGHGGAADGQALVGLDRVEALGERADDVGHDHDGRRAAGRPGPGRRDAVRRARRWDATPGGARLVGDRESGRRARS